MATLSSIGIGSGVTADTIDKLMAVEARPKLLLQTAEASIQTKISAFGTVQSALSAFRDAALKVTNVNTWTANAATSSDATVATVSAAAGTAPGQYTLTVGSLATAQSVASTAYASSGTPPGTGTLKIELGAWNAGQTTFTPKSGVTAMNIDITGTDTLAGVRDKINAAKAGVTAAIVTDAAGARLVLGGSTGASNGFRVTATDADGNDTDAAGLSKLAFDPSAGINSMSQQQAGADASATINGLPVTSASNTLSGVVDGITITLLKGGAGATTQLGVTQDTAAVKGAIQAFVTAYNALSSGLSAQTKYDSTSKEAGALQGDSTAVSLQRQLRNLVASPSPASTQLTTLSAAGLAVQPDGSLQIDDAKLTAALANLPEARKLFAATNVQQPSQGGVVQRLRQFADQVLGTEGSLSKRSEGLQAALTANQKRQADFDTKLEKTRKRLEEQYTALDTRMAGLTALNTYISQQITNWNKDNG